MRHLASHDEELAMSETASLYLPAALRAAQAAGI